MPDELSEDQLADIGARAAREAIEAAKTEQARREYGESAGAPGVASGESARTPRAGSYQEAEALVLDRLAKGDGLGDSKGRLAQSRWQAGRIREAFQAAIERPSYRSFSRPSEPADKRISDDRAPSRGGRGPLSR